MSVARATTINVRVAAWQIHVRPTSASRTDFMSSGAALLRCNIEARTVPHLAASQRTSATRCVAEAEEAQFQSRLPSPTSLKYK